MNSLEIHWTHLLPLIRSRTVHISTCLWVKTLLSHTSHIIDCCDSRLYWDIILRLHALRI